MRPVGVFPPDNEQIKPGPWWGPWGPLGGHAPTVTSVRGRHCLNSPSDVLIAIRLPRPWQRLQPPEASVSRASSVRDVKMKYYLIKIKLSF